MEFQSLRGFEVEEAIREALKRIISVTDDMQGLAVTPSCARAITSSLADCFTDVNA